MSTLRCLVRQKPVAATPEELVRQKLLAWLNTSRRVPFSVMHCEAALSAYGAVGKERADVVVHAPNGGLWLLAECKAPGLLHMDSWAGQVQRYLEVLRPRYVLGTDGSRLVLYALEGEAYTPAQQLPQWSQL